MSINQSFLAVDYPFNSVVPEVLSLRKGILPPIPVVLNKRTFKVCQVITLAVFILGRALRPDGRILDSDEHFDSVNTVRRTDC